MRFRLPEEGDKDALRVYVREHYDHGETSVSASMRLAASDYAEWLEKIRRNAREGSEERGGRSLLFLCFDEDRLVGLLSVRYELPAQLSERFGDIGYGVRPSERNKGYATAMLRYALSVCREKGMDRAIVGCFEDNPASEAVIRKNGGVFLTENENYKPGRLCRYFSIDLTADGARKE